MITAELLKELGLIPADQVQEPTIPVDSYLQESENLRPWCLADKEKLVAKGLNWAVFECLHPRIGACREAQSLWVAERKGQAEAIKAWKEKSPEAYELRDELLHSFTYAYRNDSAVLDRVAEIREGSGSADMIQDLNDLSVLGKANPKPLQSIKFDMSLLDKSASESTVMAALLALANGDKETPSEKKILRDRAFTHLKKAVDEIRACGKYTFWKEPDRLKGYMSDYRHKTNSRSKKKNDTNPDSDGSEK